VTCAIDNEEWFHYPDARFIQGRVGFSTNGAGVRFRDIVLSDANGKILLKGPPRLPKRKIMEPLILGGSWRADGNVLVGSRSAPTTAAILFGDQSFSAYDISFQAKVASHGQFFALFHQQGGGNGGCLHFGNTNQRRINLYFRRNGEPVAPAEGRPMPIEGGRWYDVKISVRGPKIWCSVGEQVEIRCADLPFASGMFGFGTFGSETRFRNISVSTPDGKPLWQGLQGLFGETVVQLGAPGGANERVPLKPTEKTVKAAAVPGLGPGISGGRPATNPAAGSRGDLLPAGDSGQGAEWLYTTKEPGGQWKEPNFAESGWKRGHMGFGTDNQRQVVVGTPLQVPVIWLRREFDCPPLAAGDLLILRQSRLQCGCEIFVNGRLLYAHDRGSPYSDFVLGPAQKALFRSGQKNVIAIKRVRTDWVGNGLVNIDFGMRLRKPQAKPAESDGDAVSVFHRNDLTGWRKTQGFWRLEDGVLIGMAPEGQPKLINLVSQKEYGDFELTFRANVIEGRPGHDRSAVFFRSRVRDESTLELRGGQTQINAFRGGLVGIEGELDPAQSTLATAAYKVGDFNDITIKCVGKRVTTAVNGFTIVDADFDGLHDKGFIAWQIPGGTGAKKAIFKDVKIRELDPRWPRPQPVGAAFRGSRRSTLTTGFMCGS
jgi:Domain of Unknown Function (DUF1080)